ncbi:MAG: hypothetical protein QOF06_1763 [Solirubrobacterales bacterium]|nr:hypothetical protein [Solirubrobacterales bacterium]
MLCADLLETTDLWIHRRKEVVSIHDEGALKRQLSVDFTLSDCPRYVEWQALTNTIFGQKIAAAPLFFLEKRPAWLMGFDLRDESGRTLPLMTSGDNGALSAAALRELARRCLVRKGLSLSSTVAKMLRALARGSRTEAERWLRRFEFPLPSDSEEDRKAMAALWADDDLQWWLMTMAESSVVLVAYEKAAAQRRVLKLGYDEPIGNQPKLWARFGWAPFKTWIVSPFIEGERYHLEIQAPRGMRLTRAALIDDEHDDPQVDLDLTRRAHLYVDDARRSGGALTEIWLRVSGQGFLGGAGLSALLVVLAITACLHWNREIAENPTGAPALLLLLPAVIASYVGRPGQHPLTTHLLSIPRWALVLGAGGAAYYAAARLALAGSTPETPTEIDDRAAAISCWLWPAFGIAMAAFVVLSIGFLASRSQSHTIANRLRRAWGARAGDRFELTYDLPLTAAAAIGYCSGSLEPALLSPRQRGKATRVKSSPNRHALFRTSGPIRWAHDFRLQPGAAGTRVVQSFVAKSKWLPAWVIALFVAWRRRAAKRRGDQLNQRLVDAQDDSKAKDA